MIAMQTEVKKMSAIVTEALAGMSDMDTTGADFQKRTVEVTPGGN